MGGAGRFAEAQPGADEKETEVRLDIVGLGAA
jgi:hypothetical protein